MAEAARVPSVGRNILANYIGQAAATLLSLALVPVYIRYLGIEAYALVGVFTVIQAWLVLLDLGMTPTLGREMARFSAGTVPVQFIRDLLRSLETIYLGLAVVVAVSLTLGANFLAQHWLNVEKMPIGTVAGALSMLGIVVALRFCEGIYRSGLMALQQQVWVNVVGTLLAMLRSLGAWAVLAVEPSIKAFFIWQALISVVTLAVLAIRLHRSLPAPPRPARFSPEVLAQIRGFAGGIFGVTLLALMLTQIDKVLLSRFLPLTEFGYYMLASTMAGGLYLASAPIGQGIAPVLVKLVEAGDDAPLSRAYHHSSQLMTVALAPAAMMLAFFSNGVMLAWSGDPVLAAFTAPILALLALGTFINAQLQVPYQLQIAIGWTSLALKMNIIAAAVLVPALLFVAPRYGAPAAAAIWLVVNSFYLAVVMPRVHRRVLRGELRTWYVADVGIPVLAVLAVVGPASLVAPMLGLGRWGWLVFLGGVGLMATAAAVMAAPLVRVRVLDAASRFRRRVTVSR